MIPYMNLKRVKVSMKKKMITKKMITKKMSTKKMNTKKMITNMVASAKKPTNASAQVNYMKKVRPCQ